MKYDEIMEKVEVTGEMRSRILANISKAASENAKANAFENSANKISDTDSVGTSGKESVDDLGKNVKILRFARRMSKFAPIIGAAAAALVCVIIFLPRVLNKNALGGVPTSTETCDTTESYNANDTCTETVSSDYSYTDTDQCESDVSSDYSGAGSWYDVAYTSKAVRVAWTKAGSIYSGAVNSEQLADGEYGLPVYKFDTKDDIEAFESEYGKVFYLDSANGGGGRTFYEETEGYDDEFFTDHSLIMVYMTSGSGSYEYDISGIYCEGNTLYIETAQLNHPKVCTQDMAGWLLIAEVDKADIENCSEFIAY